MNCNIPVFIFFGVNMERVWWQQVLDRKPPIIGKIILRMLNSDRDSKWM